MTPTPALHSRNFSIFFAGVLLSNVGSRMTIVAMAYQIYQLTNSPLDIGLLGLARGIPQVALAVFGGVLADTFDRRRLLMRLQLATALVSCSLAVLTIAGRIAPWALVAASIAYAFSSALQTPSQQAAVPNLVPQDDLRSAVALYNVQRQVSQVVGPGLAGVALTLADPALVYSIDAASWVAICVALVLIRVPFQGKSRAVATWQALTDGVSFVRSHQVILAFMLLDFGAQFFGSAQALLPVYARDILRTGPLGLGILYAALPVGSLAAALALSARAQVDKAGRWVLIGVAVYSVATIGFAVSSSLWLSISLLVVAGLGSTVGSVLRGTTNQLLTPDHLRGRVAAINSIFTGGGPQLGQFESGVVAELWGAPIAALSGGVGSLVMVVLLSLLASVRGFRFSSHAVRERVGIA